MTEPVSSSSVCGSCGREGLVLRVCAKLGPGRFCSSCSERARARPCSVCGAVRPSRQRRDGGQAVCGSCVTRQNAAAARDATRRAVIDVVGRVEPGLAPEVIAAAVDQACGTTGRLTKVADALGTDPGCLVVGRSAHPVEVDRLAVALREAGATTVAGFVCQRCGRRGRCRAVSGGQAICEICSPKRQAVCAGCGRTAAVAAVWSAGPVCSTCYQRELASKGICEGCGRTRRIDPRHGGGRALCSDCAELPPMAICEGCGDEDRIWRNHRCLTCNLAGRLDQLLAGPGGGVAADLAGLRTALICAGSPRQVLRWLASPGIESTLAGMAKGELPLSHEQLDSLGRATWVAHLRHVLVAVGVLPARDELLAGLEAWIEAKLEDVAEVGDRQQLATFATWWVLRRRRARAGRRPVGSAEHAHQVVNAAIGLLGWLRAHGRSLEDATQPDVDLFLASGPPSRRRAREFLRWAGRHRLCANLDIARRRDALPVPSADLAELARTARRLLVDDDVALVDRVAGLLVICYGQPASRIVELTVDRVGQHGAMTTLRIGSTDIELPDAFAALLGRLVNDRRGYAVVDSPDAGWLFLGARPGRPLSAKQLSTRLGRLGINLRAARTTVLIDFAGELAPTVIADTLGLSTSAAVRWVKAASGDWNAYAAARARAG
jgi:hypothetical protein